MKTNLLDHLYLNLSVYKWQYKGIAQVNESALKQMEVAHENFKVEVPSAF